MPPPPARWRNETISGCARSLSISISLAVVVAVRSCSHCSARRMYLVATLIESPSEARQVNDEPLLRLVYWRAMVRSCDTRTARRRRRRRDNEIGFSMSAYLLLPACWSGCRRTTGTSSCNRIDARRVRISGGSAEIKSQCRW